MMACVCNKIVSSPFAIIGSIGVVAAIPNFHKVLKKNNVDYELHTACGVKFIIHIILFEHFMKIRNSRNYTY